MTAVLPLSTQSMVLTDARGAGRAMRVSWHHEAGVVVLSLWQSEHCVGSFRLVTDDVRRLVDTLQAGLADEADPPDESRTVNHIEGARGGS